MTSINLSNLHPSFTPISHLPGAPGEGEVVLLMGDPSGSGDVPLSDAESRRAAVMASEETRLRFIAARQYLRSTLSRWLEISASEVEIITNEHGKPRLVSPESESTIHFSIAHSARHVAIAFSRREVGLDLESERQVDTHSLSKRFFSAEEAVAVREAETPGFFFKLWTCREAAIKADGKGIANLMGITKVYLDGDRGGAELAMTIGSDTWRALHWEMREESGLSYGALAFRERPTLISWCDLR